MNQYYEVGKKREYTEVFLVLLKAIVTRLSLYCVKGLGDL